MGKDKLRRFSEIKLLNNVTEYNFHDDSIQLNFNSIFSNKNPIVLELGCGKGEYTVNLARKYKNQNFIGVDIKGNRIYVGAKLAIEEHLTNVHFLRTRIDFIDRCLGEQSVDEIWLTFSDPQPKKPRKRLSSELFIERYKKFLKPKGIIHLKTDSDILFEYTLNQIAINNYSCNISSRDIKKEMNKFSLELQNKLKIETHYEKLFAKKGSSIKYCQFSIR